MPCKEVSKSDKNERNTHPSAFFAGKDDTTATVMHAVSSCEHRQHVEDSQKNGTLASYKRKQGGWG
jgi:hypothetical protein